MDVQHPIDLVQTGFEAAGVLVLLLGAVFALVSYVVALLHRVPALNAYRLLRRRLGRAI